MNEDFVSLFAMLCGAISFFYGLAAYFEAGISQGNYGLVALPLGLGIFIGFSIKYIPKGG